MSKKSSPLVTLLRENPYIQGLLLALYDPPKAKMVALAFYQNNIGIFRCDSDDEASELSDELIEGVTSAPEYFQAMRKTEVRSLEVLLEFLGEEAPRVGVEAEENEFEAADDDEEDLDQDGEGDER